jgi:hypothetical protein
MTEPRSPGDDAEAFVNEHREAYERLRRVWEERRREWQLYVTMPTSQRPPDYHVRVARAKASVDKAMMEWRVKGRKAQYEWQLAIVEEQAGQGMQEQEGDFHK